VENFQRFCSNYLATGIEGFDRSILFTGEEAIDWVNREGKAWPATIGADEARQAGVVVALDVRTGKRTPIWGMGRYNHENSVAIPGYDDLVVLSTDDTFVSNPVQSQLYTYIVGASDRAKDKDGSRALLKDQGDLWAFVSDTPASTTTTTSPSAPPRASRATS
jgi:secreted PhoX family phosphatase